MVPRIEGGGSGNASENLNEMQEVRAELRRRRAMRMQNINTYSTYNVPQTDYNIPMVQGGMQPGPPPAGNPNRIFQPVHPVNHFVHPDDHIEWLKGRTYSVCRKVAWGKTHT